MEKNLSNVDESTKKKIKGITNLLSKAIQKVGRITTQLRPDILDTLGLKEAVESHAEELESNTGIKIFVDTDSFESNVSKEATTAIFRIFQEAITNCIKHSKASEINVRLISGKDSCVMEVKDNGVGYVQKQLKSGYGIIGMKERALMIGGNLKIISRKNKGTRVVLKVPF